MYFEEYESCMLCNRKCGVNRTKGELGFCSLGDTVRIARAALHHWEEPIISGSCGSGAIFFSGCSLACVFCQNREISQKLHGKDVTVERLSEIMIELQSLGAHNINLVTATHFAPSVREAIKTAKGLGLNVPIVYNTGSYETKTALSLFDGLVDIYLPDYKFYKAETADKYSSAPDYPDRAEEAICEMLRQVGEPVIKNGIMHRGVIIRILELPMHVAEAKLSLKRLFKKFGNRVIYSLMNQYTPNPELPPPLNRAVTEEEYSELVDYALRLGMEKAFIQEKGTANESYVPKFDNTGV